MPMFVVGAYGSRPEAPATPDGFRSYVDAVLALPGVDGLEIPFQPDGPLSAWSDTNYLHATDPRTTHVLTTIPGMMMGAQSEPSFGLASAEESTRQQALALARRGFEFVTEINDGPGGDIVGVQYHSAPPHQHSSVEAFERSLQEIAAWDWGDTWLAVEHCDAKTDAHDPEKGFRTMDEELQAIDGLPFGMVINWGRSVIETRVAEGVRTHLALARKAGRLDGLIFSGASPEQTAIGHPWADVHVPIRDWSATSPLAEDSASSLLTASHIDACTSDALDAPELRFLGVKVKSPPGASLEERIELVGANVAIVVSSEQKLRSGQKL